MTFVKTPRKVLLFLSLIVLSFSLTESKNVLKKNGVSSKDYNQDGLKKYFEFGFDIANFGEDQKNCWKFIWGAGYNNYKKFLESLWASSIEPFIKSPSQEKLDLNNHLDNFINKEIRNEVLIDSTKNPVTCQSFLNSKRRQNLIDKDIKEHAMKAFNIVLPSKTASPKLFVTSAVSSHRDIVPNKDIYKVLNGNKQP